MTLYKPDCVSNYYELHALSFASLLLVTYAKTWMERVLFETW